MHDPAVLFLDEPTSGVDPLTRREFWAHINAMVEHGVTVMVTTHFLDEAEYCDRIGLVYQGHVIAEGSPDVSKIGPPPRSARSRRWKMPSSIWSKPTTSSGRRHERPAVTGPRRLAAPRRWAGRKEMLQIRRDPSSYLIAGLLPLLLLFIFGYGVTLDLRRVPVAVVIEQSTPDADSLLASFHNSPYFNVIAAHDRAAGRRRIGRRPLQRCRRAGRRLLPIVWVAANRRRCKCWSTAAIPIPPAWC